jgi:Family of unknown function (DUF5670)
LHARNIAQPLVGDYLYRLEQRFGDISSPMTCIYARPAQTWNRERRSLMFLILAVVLVILWLGGFFVLHISSFLIHLLLIFAVISIIMNFVGGRRSV